jgi:hypothetical protein
MGKGASGSRLLLSGMYDCHGLSKLNRGVESALPHYLLTACCSSLKEGSR